MTWIVSFSPKGWIAPERRARPLLGAVEQILGSKTGRANSVPAFMDFYILAKPLHYFNFFHLDGKRASGSRFS
jgi:hypothetical protein